MILCSSIQISPLAQYNICDVFIILGKQCSSSDVSLLDIYKVGVGWGGGGGGGGGGGRLSNRNLYCQLQMHSSTHPRIH